MTQCGTHTYAINSRGEVFQGENISGVVHIGLWSRSKSGLIDTNIFLSQVHAVACNDVHVKTVQEENKKQLSGPGQITCIALSAELHTS